MRRFLDWTAGQAGGGQQQATNPQHLDLNKPSARDPDLPRPANPTQELEIQHLLKLLHEIKYHQASSSPLPSVAGSQNQRDFVDKVHKTLPLFLNIFGSNHNKFFKSLERTDFAYSTDQHDSSFRNESTSSPISKPSSPQPHPSVQHMERFPDLLPFALTIARLFVSEVRQRASNKHAEDASIAILNFLNPKRSSHPSQDQEDGLVDASQGWYLLLSLNTLASQKSQMIQLLCDASLPSTLIKCLYLFFDLPNDVFNANQEPIKANDKDCNNIAISPLIKAFTQLLVQLCSHQSAIDELIKKDDLRLLIGIASSQCSSQNRPWRKTAFQALIAISRNMKENFVYLEQNLCIQVYVENLHRINSLGLANANEFVDMIKVLIEFVYNLDVGNRNQVRNISPVIDQFKNSRIVEFIEELLIRIDEVISHDGQPAESSTSDRDCSTNPASQQPSISSEPDNSCIDDYRRSGRKLIQSLTSMAKINIIPEALHSLANLRPLATSRFEMLESFKMPRPSAKDCILNVEAIRLLKLAWSKCTDIFLIDAVLDSTISLFNDDKFNYFIFESQQLLVYYMTGHNFSLFSYKMKQKLLKFLEFIMIETNYIPCLELGTLGAIIKNKTTSDIDHILSLKTLIACLKFNSKFSDIFREIGLLEVLVGLLTETMQQDNLSQNNTDKLEILYLLLEASQYLLAGPNNLNCIQFNESGAARHVFNCIAKPKFFQLFVPAHSSSSDDGGPLINSRTSTPTPTTQAKFKHANSILNQYPHLIEPHVTRLQNKPSIKQMHKVAFTIIRQLILSTAGDEHLANLLGLLARNLEDLKNLAIIDNLCEESENSEGAKTKSSEIDYTFLLTQEVNLKISILKSLMIILKDSHRSRALFRKVGGFIYIVSCIGVLEKALPLCDGMKDSSIEMHNRWNKINTRRIWRLIKSSMMAIVIAIRSEPANLRTFTDEALSKFSNAIRNLGCFQADQLVLTQSKDDPSQHMKSLSSYRSIFLAPSSRDFSTIAGDSIKASEACCQIFRFLYDMSLNMTDGTTELEMQLDHQVMSHKSTRNSKESRSISFDYENTQANSSVFVRRSQVHRVSLRPPSLDLKTSCVEKALITFPCIIISILDLIPSCPTDDLKIFICVVIKSLFKHERNQQLLCDAGMISKLLELNWRLSINDKSHFLYQFGSFMLEKLSKQSITPKELRMFLRLGEPLKCKNLDSIEVVESCDETKQKLIESAAKKSYQSSENSSIPKEKVPTDKIETFVSMLSDGPTKQPPFIEFDMMSSDGCSSIFLPSIAPVNARSLPQNSSSFLNSTLDVHTTEKNGILGGVGSTERQFPPITGLSYSSWIRIESFPARSSDSNHNIHLLTIYRGSAATGKEYSCFRMQISALDRALTISTQESLLFDNETRNDTQLDPDCHLRVWTPELLVEGRWHHLAVTMSRSAAKPTNIVVYVDSIPVHSQKICYINNHVGATNFGPLGNSGLTGGVGSPAAYVNAFIGSLPQFRFHLRTCWKQGPCHLVEEPLSPNMVSIIYALGPEFVGNFQSSGKLIDMLRFKNLSSSNEAHKNQNKSTESLHKPITHQQSAIIQSPRHNNVQLTRVSSSSAGSHSYNQTSNQSLGHCNIAEDRMLMNIDARATSLMSLSRMRRVYTRFDCRQVSRVLGVALNENSTPILLFHNTGVHLNGPSRGIGAITISHNQVRSFVPGPTEQTLFNIGGCYILIGLIAQAQSSESFVASLRAFVGALKSNTKMQAQMDSINGYQILSVFLWKKKHLLSTQVLDLINSLVVGTLPHQCDQNSVKPIHQVSALRELICESFDLWLQTDMMNLVLEFIHNLINSSAPTNSEPGKISGPRSRNLKCLRDMDLLPRMLRLLLRHDSGQQKLCSSDFYHNRDDMVTTRVFDSKAVYLIKQTVFELLNRTPRQSDILYFGQFLASLLPSKTKEKSETTINLRNILLKSLLQMMTKNRQQEYNNAMQEEYVRILGFDWFMLFIAGSHLDTETITLGFLNLMIVLSNENLYTIFKSKNPTNGGWLKEPTFSSIDNSNIQLLGINAGAFFGPNGRRKAIKQDVLDAPNLYLLTSCLSNLLKMPRIYLMIFMTMMSKLTISDLSVSDTIETFDKLNLDILCDSLIGDTHHKRRQSLTGIQFKCHELVVCLVYMIREIMCQYHEPLEIESNPKESTDSEYRQHEDYPVEIVRFFMYLYNNNQEFQTYCRRSDNLIDSLCETLMRPSQNISRRSNSNLDQQVDESEPLVDNRMMTRHPASKEILELSILIILDKMTEINPSSGSNPTNLEQLHAFERFLESLNSCRDAQGELIDSLLRQILLTIDSNARQNSIKTLGSSDNIMQFQLLLINSISVSQIVVDKLWMSELFQDNLNRILNIFDHQLSLAEQVYRFNEILPKSSPPHPFIMQKILNRLILFALSRPIRHMSDNITILEILKKIYDNKTIIILNHMHSPNSAEFFVCLTFCLIKIIEDNSVSRPKDLQASLIERQYGHVSLASRDSHNSSEPSSTALILVSMARKVWDSIYQSKKGILSEAFDVSLSLPAFTLETSLDLMQLKPDIIETCERYWSILVDSELRTRRRVNQRQSDPHVGTQATSAVNILSGRLTRVVNAANFVSRVVGATAGTMASNVNLVGEKLSQKTSNRLGSRISVDNSSLSQQHQQSSQESVSGQCNNRSFADQPELFKYALDKSQIEDALRVHISIIQDYIKSQLSQRNHKLALHKYLCDEWLDTENEVLLRERAVFGPDYGSILDKWCLDMTEGPRRMRKKMVNNTRNFYDNYPYRPEHFNPSNKSLRYRPPMSYDSHLYYIKTLNLDNHLLELTDVIPTVTEPINNTEELKQEVTSDNREMPSSADQEILPQIATIQLDTFDSDREGSPAINIESHTTLNKETGPSTQALKPMDLNSSIESLATPSDNKLARSESPKNDNSDRFDDGDNTSFVDFSPEIEAETNSARESENIDSLSVLRLLEKNERISHMFRCSRVQGLDTYEGLLLFGREHFYLIDGFTLLKTREIKDIDSLPPDAHDSIIPNSTPNIMARSKKTCAKFSFDSVVEVHKRRYLLQPIALEVFSSDGRNTLIVFPRNIRNKVYSRLMTVSTQLNSDTHESLAGQKSNVSVEGGSGLLSNLIGETSVTQRWVRGELSNFQYLMNLNTIAGRSYNDLMQYPIFPWILADYSSDCLDLTKPSAFRDLSRPIGAQTSDRLDQFKRRYAEWDDAETPPYHYGTFYSSAMIVASYMVRMEPFTQHFLRLQGGHFDLADRMFHSIQDSWLSASKHNMADIKELIPEFFYLPEFLTNNNKFDLGIKQNGMKLDDVILPPWAKNDAREFIRLHRCALESDYVSAHLHEWIDLIFGYKQQGQPAVDAVNVFHHLFYEGNVDIYNTDIDPIKKNAVIGFINNFGQVPKQLFKKPHPSRKVLASSVGVSSTPLTPILPSLSVTSGVMAAPRVLTHYPHSLKQVNSTIKDLRGPVGQIIQIDKNVVAVEQNKLLIPPEYCRYVAWGHADRSLRLSLYDSEKPVFVWEGSEFMLPNEVFCCTIPNSRTMITAGADSIINVWRIDRVRSFTPILNLYGHVEPVTCLASSQSYSLIVSGSRDRTAIIWDLNRFTFVRQLGGGPSDKLVHHGPISAVAINDSTGDIATCASSWLYLWTINGELLAQVDSFSVAIQQSMSGASSIATNLSQLHILSVTFSQHNEWDSDEVIVTGGSDGSVALWSLRYFQSPMTDAEIEEANKKAEEASSLMIEHSNDNLEHLKPSDLPSDQVCDQSDSRQQPTDHLKTSSNAQAEPIAIKGGRQRTDTMNSEWVRLSTSSTSTAETFPNLQTTPNSLCDHMGDMFSGEFSNGYPAADSPTQPNKTSNPNNINSCSTLTPGCTSIGQSSPSNEDLDGHSMSKANLLLTPNDPSLIKFSKSDTALIDSFVLLGDASESPSNAATLCSPSGDINHRNENINRPQSSTGTPRLCSTPQARARRRLVSSKDQRFDPRFDPKLQHNHTWRRELFLRMLLPRRNSKIMPSPVTSLAISKDHKTLYVGESTGRISCWSTS